MATVKPLKLTIIGATDFLGREVLKALDESDMLLAEVTLFADDDDAGETLTCQGADVEVTPLHDLTEAALSTADIILFCGTAAQVQKYSPQTLKTRALTFDGTGTLLGAHFVADAENPPKPEILHHKGGVLPHPIAASLALVVGQINQKHPVKDVQISTYQSVAGAGLAAVKEVAEQSIGLLGGAAGDDGFSSHIFAHQAAFNVLPQVGEFLPTGETTEEAVLSKSFTTLMGGHITIGAHCAYVPTFVGDGVDVTLTFTSATPTPEEVRTAFSLTSGIMLLDDFTKNEYATPYGAAETSYVFVSRVRQQGEKIRLWLVADHVRVMVARKLVRMAEVFAHTRQPQQ